MSTLNTTNLKNGSSVTNNIVLGADGSVDLDGGVLYVDAANDRVGIGTASANAKLVVSDGGNGGLEVSPGPSSTTIYSYNRTTSAYIEQRYDGSSHIFQVGGSSNEKARIDAAGRLLVGTSTAISGGEGQYGKIQVVGNSFSATDTGYISLAHGGTGASIASGTRVGKIVFSGTDNSEFGSIVCAADGTTGSGDYPGRLVFSTTADGASSPTERMRIRSNGIQTAFATTTVHYAASATGAGTSEYLYAGSYGATGTNSIGTVSFRVFTNGNVQNTNNSYTAISDIKLKQNIVDAKSQWDDLKDLRVVNYNFKEGQTHTQIGLIAQEVELVSPGLVSESPDRDSEGNDLGTVTKSVNYSVLYMKAVKALQEAMERIETLEAKVAALEGA